MNAGKQKGMTQTGEANTMFSVATHHTLSTAREDRG